MHNKVPDFFWFHGLANFSLKLKWVRSKDKAEADDFSQPDADAHVQLEEAKFEELRTGGCRDFVVDLA